MNYKKTSPRLTIKYVDTDTDEILFEVGDRNWSNVGEFFTDHYVNTIMTQEMKGRKPPKNLMLIVVNEYSLET